MNIETALRRVYMPGMVQPDLAALLPTLLPLASEWATAQWELAMQIGKPLHPLSREDAKAMGVRDPDAVRVLLVERMPNPEAYPELMEAVHSLSFLTENTAGLAIHTAILIRRERDGDRRLIAHELAHVAQYERLGGIQAFLAAYFAEVIQFGYREAPMEREAEDKAEAVPHVWLP